MLKSNFIEIDRCVSERQVDTNVVYALQEKNRDDNIYESGQTNIDK